jgi:serine protease
VGFADVGPEVALAAPGGNCVNTGANDPCLYPIITATNAGATTPLAGSSVYTDAFNIAVGTSFSAPLVAGTAGLMFSARPGLAVADVRSLLQGTSRSFPTTGGTSGISACHAPNSSDQAECYCTTTTCGAGMLDAGAAVAAADRGLLARISLGNNAPRAEVELTLSAATSYVITGRTLATYQWALVDGGGIVSAIANASGPTATVTPTGSGRFTVQLTVTDSSGAQSTSNRSVDVLPVVSNPPLITGDGGGGGGGALGLAWLAGLAAAVLALQWQRKRRLHAKPVR